MKIKKKPSLKAILSPYVGEKEIEILLSLTFPDGTPILSLDRIHLFVNIIDMLKKMPFEDVITYLKSVKNPRKALLYSPLLENERERAEFDIETIARKIEVEKGVARCTTCAKLGEEYGWEILSNQLQTRAADEPMTTLYRCVTCGKQWQAG